MNLKDVNVPKITALYMYVKITNIFSIN